MAPKNQKTAKKPSSKTEVKSPPEINDSPFLIDKKSGNILLKILAKPGSKTSEITGICSEGVDVKIGAPPVDGEANTELISFLSKMFGLRKSDVVLDKGSRSRNKTVIIMKDAGKSVESLESIIKANLGT